MRKKNNYYDCVMYSTKYFKDLKEYEYCYLFDYHLATIRLKGLYSVCKFLESVNFIQVYVRIISPTGYEFDGHDLYKIWSSK